MRFSCDHCKARYSIPDERVRGRVLKIRCSKCSTVITVREAPKAAVEVEESTRVASSSDLARLARNATGPSGSDEPTRAGAPPGPIWYVLVNGQQIGPVDTDDLQKRARKGDVTAKSFVWRDGMGDWKRISEVPDLAMVLRPAAPAPEKRSPAPVPKGSTMEVPAVRQRDVPADVFAAADAPPFASMDDVVEATRDDPSEERTLMASLSELSQHGAQAAQQPAKAKKGSKRVDAAAMPFEVPVDLSSDEVVAKQPSKPAEKPLAPKPSEKSKPVELKELREQLLEPKTNPFEDLMALGVVKGSKKEKPHDDASKKEKSSSSDDGSKKEKKDKDSGRLGEAANLDPFVAPAKADGKPGGDAAADPFAAATKQKDSSGGGHHGEETRFFITQAGIADRNPKWKIALFLLLIVGLPVAVVYSLSQFRVINIDVPVTVDEEGHQVKASVFSTEGVQALRDMLLRKPPKVIPGAPTAPTARRPIALPRDRQKSDGGISKAALEAAKDLYQNNDGMDVGPKVQKDKIAENVTVNRGAGLDEAVVAEKVKQSQAAFQSCVEAELRRNPNVRLGKMDLMANVGSSGTVVSASIDRTDVATTSLGTCLVDRAKRMVFPPSTDGTSTEIHIPLHFQTQL